LAGVAGARHDVEPRPHQIAVASTRVRVCARRDRESCAAARRIAGRVSADVTRVQRVQHQKVRLGIRRGFSRARLEERQRVGVSRRGDVGGGESPGGRAVAGLGIEGGAGHSAGAGHVALAQVGIHQERGDRRIVNAALAGQIPRRNGRPVVAVDCVGRAEQELDGRRGRALCGGLLQLCRDRTG